MSQLVADHRFTHGHSLVNKYVLHLQPVYQIVAYTCSSGRFIRRTLHEPNLIIWFGACKDRRMNQLGSTDLYLSRPAVLFDCASRIERQKFDLNSDVELLHVPNQMHTALRINYINYTYPRGLRVPSTWHAICAKDFILNKMAGKKELMCLFFLFRNN